MKTAFNTLENYALTQDAADELAVYKEKFHFPQHNGENAVYFCGNSLGLQPKTAEDAIQQELKDWRELAVEGYFKAQTPWLYYQNIVSKNLGPIMGAKEDEFTVMNTLTVNLHIMLQSFYRPSKDRFKIIMEAGAFPSDQYAIETVVKMHGLDPAAAIIELSPRPGEKLLNTEDIIAAINDQGAGTALLLMGGINYYTGQFYDIPAISAAAQAQGAYAGWDLAHVAGNIPVQLHDWNVDFAVWCSYKYFNSGPGAVGGLFVHEKHGNDRSFPRPGGWWGNEEATRFKMEKGFVPKQGAAGWQISTAQVFNMVTLKASLDIFKDADIQKLRAKSVHLTSYLEYLLSQLTLPCEILTPTDTSARGAQLSLYFPDNGKAIHQKMMDNGIICDYREPGVIRLAPAPLYCSYNDVYRFYKVLSSF